MVIAAVAAALAAAAAGGCGGGNADRAITVPPSANSKIKLPKVEPVRGKDHERQALEGAIARSVQWGNLYYGKTTLDTAAQNVCTKQVDDLWYCYVTINVVKPFKGYKEGPRPGVYTVTRDTTTNKLIYIPGTS